MKITILSPHRDDAAFSAGLAVGAWLDACHDVTVMNCFTNSEYAPLAESESGAESASTRVTEIRRQEDVHWIECYDKNVDLIDLNLMDAPLRLGCGVGEVCSRRVDPNDLSLEHIREALEQEMTDALVLPLGVGGHVDHMTTRAASQHGWPSSLPVAFYEDLPYAARPGAAESIGTLARTVSFDLRPGFACAMAQTAVARERKLRMAFCYATQITLDVAEQIAGFCEPYGGRERFWVNPAWFAAGPGIFV